MCQLVACKGGCQEGGVGGGPPRVEGGMPLRAVGKMTLIVGDGCRVDTFRHRTGWQVCFLHQLVDELDGLLFVHICPRGYWVLKPLEEHRLPLHVLMFL